MYGLIGKMVAIPGQREPLISELLDGVDKLPGCLSFVVARDEDSADAIWITEVWDSEASHKASLELPFIKASIARAMPLIAKFENPQKTKPVGG